MEAEVCWLLQWRSVPCMLWWSVWEERAQGREVFGEVEERPGS